MPKLLTRSDNAPLWWISYNEVKHARHTSFSQATMKNAVNALAALYLVTLELNCREQADAELLTLHTKEDLAINITPRPRLFELGRCTEARR